MTSQRAPLTHRRQKKKNYGSLDTRVQMEENDESDDHEHKPTAAHKKKPKLTFSEWIRNDPSHKLSVAYFCISIIIPFFIGVYYFILGNKETAYIVAGIYGIATAVYGMNHFRLFFSLKQEIDLYVEQNNRFRNERNSVNNDVNQIKAAIGELKYTRRQLRLGNRRISNLNQKFHQLELGLQALNEQHIEGITEIGAKANQLKAKHYNISLQQQKNMLWKIFDRLERSGDTKGLTKKEYKIFVKLLPKEHQERFGRLGGFKSLLRSCGSDRDYIDNKDFSKVLEVYAKMHVENKDITFKITKVLSQSSGNEAVYIRKVEHIHEMSCGGFYQTAQNIFEAKDDLESE